MMRGNRKLSDRKYIVLTDTAAADDGEASNLLDENNQEREEEEEEVVSTKFPKSVFFIIGNEFCERFSYYGLRAVLTLYLKSVLDYNNHEAIEMFHGFIFLCYFTPVFGAILADGFIGKFKTILYISIVYAIGNLLLAAAATGPLGLPTHAFSLLGLALIAIGTGGIKPCVSAFGGDQFNPNQITQLEKFFSVFYFAINAGSLLSMFITPELRAGVKCFGEENCFPLAFGVPAILMVVALVLFILGKPWYKTRPAEGTVITDFAKCVFYAVKKSVTSKEKKGHWLDHADDRFDLKFIENTKAVMHIFKLFIPIPFFWALYDQLGSRWILQATHLDGRIPGTSFYLLPDQMGVVNPVLILAFIPLFEYVIYPLLAKCKLLERPLQKMCAGGFLAAVAYVVAGFLQLRIEATEPVFPGVGYTQVRFINAAPCNVSLQTDFIQTTLTYGEFYLTSAKIKAGNYEIKVNSTDCQVSSASSTFIEEFESETAYSVIIGRQKSASNNELILFKDKDLLKKSETGKSEIIVSYIIPNKDNDTCFTFNNKPIFQNVTEDFGSTDPSLVYPDKYTLSIRSSSQSINALTSIDVGTGSVLRMVVTSNFNTSDPNNMKVKTYTIVAANTIHIVWQLPQYFIITAAEIMLSITGLQFSYTQAPVAMKSVLSAAWLLNVSFGNCIVLIIELIGTLPKPSQEYFLYASIMAADMVVFSIIAYFYKYVKFDDTESKSRSESTNKDTTAL